MREVPPVSVVIPSYNRPKLTVRAVQSVLAQTLSDFEVIVIDDGSDSNQVYPSHIIGDERVRLVRHPANLGVSAARNTGVKESRFPLVAFLDFLYGGNLHTSTWLTSRTLLEQFPFDAQFGQCEDYDVPLRMEAAGVRVHML